MLLDSAQIQISDAKHAQKRGITKAKPLYTDVDVKNALKLFRTVEYEKWFWVDKDIKAIFKDAGHILGSASVTVDITEENQTTRIGFTGDIGRWNRPILRDPIPMPECDYVITESTYGGELHLEQPQETEKLLNIILDTCIQKKGKLIIPAFSIGRTQELLYKLDLLYIDGKLPAIPVFLDSPLAINATEIFRLHPECMDKDVEEHLLKDDNPFGWNGLTYIRNKEESKMINENDAPCIIISASGMAEAGRIKHHIFHQIEKEQNTILIVGYCAEGTLGAKLVKKPDIVKIFGIEKKVLAQIEVLGSMSAHADDKEMRLFLENQKQAKNVFLVHGEEKRQLRLKNNLEQDGFKSIVIPKLGDTFNLNE
jgi:metallo-beta-lactamase family protein